MVSAASLSVHFEADTKDYDRGSKHVQDDMKGLANGLGNIFTTGVGFAVGTAVNKIVQAFGQGITSGLDFGANMANVNSILQLTDQGIAALSDQVIALTNTPGITDTPAMLAAGLYDIASSGFQGADGLKVLEAAAKAATAGVTDTATAAKGGTAILNAYGLGADSVGNVFDMMFQTVADGVITFEQLSNNLGNVLPIANSLGIGFDQVGAAFAQMTIQGVTASAAETQIAALMRAALSPTEALTAAVQDHGYASAEALIQTEGLTGFLKVLGDAAGGSKEELFKLLGSQEAMNAATLLGGENLDAYIEELLKMQSASDGAGATNKALEKQMKSSRYAIDKAKQSIATLATVTIGALAPAITAGANALTGLVTGGITPFISMMEGAITGADDWQKLVDKMPEPLRRTAHAFGSLGDSVGDLWASFQRGGLDAMLGTLINGGEGQQIIHALQAIGEEAWGALVGALEAGAQAVGIIIDVVPEIGEWLWDVGGNVVDWAIGHLPGSGNSGGASPVAGGAGGPVGDQGGSNVSILLNVLPSIGEWLWDTGVSFATWVGGHAIDLAKGAVSTVPQAFQIIAGWGGVIWGTAGDIASWITENIFGGGYASRVVGGTNGSQDPARGGGRTVGGGITIGEVALSVIAGWGGVVWGAAQDFSSWFTSNVPGLKADAVDVIVELSASFTADGSVWLNAYTALKNWVLSAPYTLSPDIQLAIEEGAYDITTALIDGITFDNLLVGGAIVGLIIAGVLLAPFVLPVIFAYKLGVAVFQGVTSAFTGIRQAVIDQMSGFFSDIFGAGDTFGANGSADPAQGFVDGAGLGEAIVTAIGTAITDAVTGITGKAAEWWGSIETAIGDIVPDSITIPALPDFTFDLGSVSTAITNAASSLIAMVPDWMKQLASGDVVGAINSLFGSSDSGSAGSSSSAGSGGAGGAGSTTGGGGVFGGGSSGGGGGGLGASGLVGAGDLKGYAADIFNNTPGANSTGSLIVPALDLSAFTASATQIPTIVGTNMDQALQLSSILSSAINTVVSANFMTLIDSVGASVNQIPGIVTGAMNAAASSGAAAALNAGASISYALANGIWMGLPAVTAAADAMAAEVERAANIRLERNSPPKVLIRMGQDVGDAFADSMLSKIPRVSSAADALGMAAIPSSRYGAYAGSSGFGGPTIQKSGDTYNITIIAPESEEYSQIARNADRGSKFAVNLGQLINNS